MNVAYLTGSQLQIFDSYRDEIDHELYDTLIAAVKGMIGNLCADKRCHL